MKKITSLITLFLIPFFYLAQWNPDISENLSLSSNGSSMVQQEVTSSGKRFIAYTELDEDAGVDRLYLQLLDISGNKMFGSSGMLLGEIQSTWTTSALQIEVDNAENCYISYGFTNEELKLYKISSTGDNFFPGGILVDNTGALDMRLTNQNELIFLTNTKIKKYTLNGVCIWTKDLTVLPEYISLGVCGGEIKEDSNGNFYALIGMSILTTNCEEVVNLKYYLQKFSVNGEELWSNYIPVNNTQGLLSHLFVVPAHLLVVDDDAIVTLPLRCEECCPNWSGSECYGQRFSSMNGERVWNDTVVKLLDSGDEYAVGGHEIYHDTDNDELYLVVTKTIGILGETPSSIKFQRIDLTNGNQLISDSETEIIPYSADIPFNMTLNKCNGEIILDILTISFNEVTEYGLLGDNKISIMKISETGEVLSLLPIKTSPTKITISYTMDKGFTIDETGQIVAVFLDHRLSNSSNFYLFAQNARVCENSSNINEQQLLNLSIYPNPAQNILNFGFDKEVSYIEIFYVDGKPILHKNIETQNLKIDISNWENGIYLYNILDQKGICSKGKFIKY